MAFTIVGDAAVISGDASISKPAAVFTGGNTDDAFTMDTLAAARTAANDTAGAFITWINTGDITSTSSIISFGDNNVVEFIDFAVSAGKLRARCTDATVAAWDVITNSVVLQAHKWHHVALVHDGARPHMYVDGVKVAITDTVSVDLTKWFFHTDGIDVGSIGAGRIGGAGAYTQEFVGGISTVKVYSATLTDTQVLADYNGANNVTNLAAVYYMTSLLDDSGNAYDLTAVSDVYMTPTYNEFISKVRQFGAVVADAAGFCENMGRMSVLFINAA